MGRAADKYVHPLPPPTVFMATSHSQPSRQLPRAGARAPHYYSLTLHREYVRDLELHTNCSALIVCVFRRLMSLSGVWYVLVLLGSGCCVVENKIILKALQIS